jgi:hypothetical protein
MIDDSTEARKSVKQREPLTPVRRLARHSRLRSVRMLNLSCEATRAAHTILPKIDAVMLVFTMKYHQSQTTSSAAAALVWPAACTKGDDSPMTVARKSRRDTCLCCNGHSRAPEAVVNIRAHLNHASLPQTTQQRQATTPSERKA